MIPYGLSTPFLNRECVGCSYGKDHCLTLPFSKVNKHKATSNLWKNLMCRSCNRQKYMSRLTITWRIYAHHQHEQLCLNNTNNISKACQIQVLDMSYNYRILQKDKPWDFHNGIWYSTRFSTIELQPFAQTNKTITILPNPWPVTMLLN